jgi:hypothetical protein
MLSNTGESRTVTVIHTSVHDFFRKSSTFGRLLVHQTDPTQTNYRNA